MHRNTIVLLLIAVLVGSCTDVVREYDNLRNRETGQNAEIDPSGFIKYSGDSLTTIEFPVGGIGTGNILLGGRGNILEWEVFGRANRDELPPYMTFFGIHGKSSSGQTFNRILEGELEPPYKNPFGIPRQQLSGVPRFSKCSFISHFPFAEVLLSDKELPVKARLLSWNPFIPLDTKNSSLPVANFDWELENTHQSDSLFLNIAFSFGNPFQDYKVVNAGNGIVEPVYSEGFRGIKITSSGSEANEFMVIAEDSASWVYSRWIEGGWWDNAEFFWRDFSEDGMIEIETGSYSYSSGSQVDVSTLGIPIQLGPGEKKKVSFGVIWRIESRAAESSMDLGSQRPENLKYRNYYSTYFKNVEEILNYYFTHEHKLEENTGLFHDLLYSSTYPAYVKDALGNNLAGLNSNLISQDENGKVHAFEGLGNDFGCCPGNCTHVWNYAQSLAYLFPDLERDMRETNFLHDTGPEGAMSFRTIFPHGPWRMNTVAADGQMGTIIRAYREWKYSGDTEWLRSIWPFVRKSLEYSWKDEDGWDKEQKGYISGRQHNTYDIDFFGANPLTTLLYLGALKAASEMADAMNEQESSDLYFEIYEKGRQWMENNLWNGDYYHQESVSAAYPGVPANYLIKPLEGQEQEIKYQFLEGCLSDQLFGQFLADVSGLGLLLDSSRTARALNSIYRNNFFQNLADIDNVQRVYAAPGEGGLVLCTWPQVNKPLVPFVYSNEVWTGVEYQVAASLIFSGQFEEGLNIAETARKRYRGFNRNPFGEIESGKFYARSFSSWALLPALSGFRYDGVSQSISFSPWKGGDFSTIWTTGNAWGRFRVSQKAIYLEVFHGTLYLENFSFYYPGSEGILEISFEEAHVEQYGDLFELSFNNLILDEKNMLTISMK